MTSKRCRHCGGVLVELAVAVAILITVLAAGVEFARALKTRLELITLSREAANRAFKECVLPDSPPAADVCLGAVVADLESGTASQMLGTVEGILSLYTWNGGAPILAEQVADGSNLSASVTPGGYTSQYKVGIILADPELNALSEDNQSVIIAEVYTEYTHVFPFIESVFTTQIGVLYDSTIF